MSDVESIRVHAYELAVSPPEPARDYPERCERGHPLDGAEWEYVEIDEGPRGALGFRDIYRAWETRCPECDALVAVGAYG